MSADTSPIHRRAATFRASPRRAREALLRLARRARRPLAPDETAATVALAEAQVNGVVENARPFRKGDRVLFRVELVVEADLVPALLAAVEAEPAPPVAA